MFLDIINKEKIYYIIYNRFSNYNKSYICKILDQLYHSGYLVDDMFYDGWKIFIESELISKIKKIIQIDLNKAKQSLLLVKCLNTIPVNNDLIEYIHKFL